MKIQVSRTMKAIDGEASITASVESELVPMSEVSELLKMLDDFVRGEISFAVENSDKA